MTVLIGALVGLAVLLASPVRSRHNATPDSSVEAEDLGRRVGVLPAQVGQQDMLADAHPACDRLADLTRPDDDDDVFHGCSFCR